MQLKRNKEMEFETLKKNYKKQIVIGALAVCVIGGVLTFATSRAFYKVDGSVDLAKGTVNYKPYDFKIMAMYQSEDGSNYTEITNMPSSGYEINEDKSYCTLDNKNKDTNAVLKTIDGNHVFNNLTKSDKCYLYFDRIELTSEDTLLKLNIKDINSGTPTFKNAATTDEGMYSMEDGMYGGTSYYWRGAATANYIMFANACWRAIRINGDGSIRLIYDGTTCHANGKTTTDSVVETNVKYNTSYNNSSYVGWTYTLNEHRTLQGISSNAKTQTEIWYNNNLGTSSGYSDKIAEGKFCNDRRVQDDEEWKATGDTQYYAGYKRLLVSYEPNLNCLAEDIYILKVGALTGDEAIMAGGNLNGNNLYYLFNGQNYWTMTPYSWYGGQNSAGVYYITASGSPNFGHVHNLYARVGIRPVINLRSDVTFSGGDGTLDNPYVVQ